MTALLSERAWNSSIARFLLAGGSATLFNLCLLWLFTRQLGLWYLAASVLSYAISVAYNFGVQKVWAFGAIGGSLPKQFPQFVAVNLLGLVLNTAMLYALVAFARLPPLSSQTIAALALSGLSFFAYRKIFLCSQASSTRPLHP